ncbi:MAG TPA: hypothetical protein VNY24_15835 [Candidatus Acidoferrales bacterium]|nr:hypothetical protein [Candidatus Acidoferrales bacterium]
MPISAVDAIDPAFQHAKRQLLQPFRFGQWARLALVGLLAGELGSGGGCNGSFNIPSTHRQGGTEQFLSLGWPKLLGDYPVMFASLIAVLIVVGIGLVVLFTYIGSVMRFILFDSIVAKECHIRKGWARRRREGYLLFVWQITLMLLSFAAFVIVVGIPAMFAWTLGWFAHPAEHVPGLVVGGILLFLVFLAVVVGFAVVHVMTKDFVVPQMALENISAFEGWSRLWLWLKAEKGGYAGYIGMKIVLAVGAGIALTIISLTVIVLLLIPIGGIGAMIWMSVKAAGATWTVHTISLAVAAGCIVLAIFVFAISMISVPAAVFFPAYSIYFLAARYPALADLVWPRPPGSVTPGEAGLT